MALCDTNVVFNLLKDLQSGVSVLHLFCRTVFTKLNVNVGAV